ncbi:MAG: peptidoglycan DD-metalloendopeptidase family protein [Desulfovibrio sp.]|jgi:septal ring factor EnvC (AmiA/AmiB activator)|nr:peptidoglycan DD-metalloendopeptidase family protein [Desulfovibrio sp.]
MRRFDPPLFLSGVRALCLGMAVAAFLALCLFPSDGFAAESLSQLEQRLAREKEKAEERRQSLKRLTEQERKLNSDLAAAEKRILELEKGIARHQTKILELGSADDEARREYESLLAEQAKTEKAQTESLRLLWEIEGRRVLSGSRDMADWAKVDREYAWSRELYAALEGYRKELDFQESRLAQVLGRRDKLSRDIQNSLNAVNGEKTRLLKARLDYDKQLADVRRHRAGTDSELQAVLKLISSLDIEIARRSGSDIATLKGNLPKPVTGGLKVRYDPDAAPASRGLGFSTAEKAEVRAVAGGTVVHNDVLRGFGTVLIVQHGDDYYSLYAFLGSSPLKVGQDVQSRQKIGTAGYYPTIKGPGLYFELRFKQKAINPEQWLAL